MKKRRLVLVVIAAVIVAAVVIFGFRHGPLVITGLVTTDEAIVSPEIQGRLQELKVDVGDQVKRGQLLARIAPAESQADLSYFENLERSAQAQVRSAEVDLKFQTDLTENQIKQADANLAAVQAQVKQAEADLELARLNFERAQQLRSAGNNSQAELDQARTGHDSAVARLAAVRKQAVASESALALAKASSSQIAMRESALAASRQQLAAATAQKEKSSVRLAYTEMHAPVDGIVNVRAALLGEVINPGQAVVTLINPDDLWIRADIEESYIDQIHLGDKYTIRLPSGAKREGTVFFRGIDASYATQRDVSRTKRDIKTFEVRLRCDNKDRSLAVGMTAYVDLTLAH